MKLIFLSSVFSIWFFLAQSQVFDHRHISTEYIPLEYIESIKQNCRLQWVGASHGHQVTDGIRFAELDNSILDATVDDCLPEAGNPFRVMDGYIPYFSTDCSCQSDWGGTENYWALPNGPSTTQEALGCYDINISGWTWCTELHDPDYDLQAYLDAIQMFEDEFPSVQFIYCTQTTEFVGEQGYNRWIHNEQIRQYCLDNDKILFDFADIECWHEDEFSYYVYTTGDTIPTRHSAFQDEGVHHSNYLNCANKGRVIWNMMAYIQGWNPNPCSGLNYELWEEQVGQSGSNLKADCNGDEQVDNQDKVMFY